MLMENRMSRVKALSIKNLVEAKQTEKHIGEAEADARRMALMSAAIVDAYKAASEYIAYGLSSGVDQETQDRYDELSILVDGIDRGVREVTKQRLRSFSR